MADAGWLLLFVDIDGVMNHHVLVGHICRRLVRRLAGLFASLPQPAAIVLSSNWRLRRHGRAAVRNVFLEEGAPEPISCTPSLPAARPTEILAWLHLNSTNLFQDAAPFANLEAQESSSFSERDWTLPARLKVRNFVALDDMDFYDDYYGGPLRHLVTERHFVHTARHFGLTEANAEQARLLLLGHSLLEGSPPHCEQCGAAPPAGYDQRVNKFFCRPECQCAYWEQWRPENWAIGLRL